MEPPAKKLITATYDIHLCWTCQNDRKDPKTKYRKSLPLIDVIDIDDVREQYRKWKKK